MASVTDAPLLHNFVLTLSDAYNNLLPVSSWHLSSDEKTAFVEVPIHGPYTTWYSVWVQNTNAAVNGLCGLFDEDRARYAFHIFHDWEGPTQHIMLQPQTLSSHFGAHVGDSVRVHILKNPVYGVSTGPDEQLGRTPTAAFIIKFVGYPAAPAKALAGPGKVAAPIAMRATDPERKLSVAIRKMKR